MEKASPLCSVLPCVPLGMCLFGTLSAGVIINDGFTTSSNYSATHIQSVTPDNNSYVDIETTVSQSIILDHVHDVSRDDDGFPISTDPMEIQSLVRFAPFTYTPSVSGVINTLSFRLDYKTTNPFDEIFFFVETTGGNGALSGFRPVVSDGDWQTVEVTGLTDSDFLNIGFSGSTPLRFGFGFTSSTPLDPFGTEPVIYQVELDNLVVTTNAVPEPASAACLAGAAVLLLRRKRKAA